jgi:hypothetical protein
LPKKEAAKMVGFSNGRLNFQVKNDKKRPKTAPADT